MRLRNEIHIETIDDICAHAPSHSVRVSEAIVHAATLLHICFPWITVQGPHGVGQTSHTVPYVREELDDAEN